MSTTITLTSSPRDPRMPMNAHLQLPLPIGPRPAREFGNFLAGDSLAAVAHLQAMSKSMTVSPAGLTVLPGAAAGGPSPVYLWGPAGSGKSHLLQALAAAVQTDGGSVVWFDGCQPAPALASARATGAALVVLDGCERFDAAAQHQAFKLFVDATTFGVQVAAAGRVPPVDLALRDDLRTRLAWGHVFALQPLSEADTRLALLQETAGRGIELADGVLGYLLTHVPRDLTHLMRLLDRLDDYGLARHRRLTVPLVRELIEGVSDSERGREPDAVSAASRSTAAPPAA